MNDAPAEQRGMYLLALSACHASRGGDDVPESTRAMLAKLAPACR